MVAFWWARAIGPLRFKISLADIKIKWVNEFKYLSYWITLKLGWYKMIKQFSVKIRQSVSMINLIKIYGKISHSLRKTLFLTYVLPLFTRLYI